MVRFLFPTLAPSILLFTGEKSLIMLYFLPLYSMCHFSVFLNGPFICAFQQFNYNGVMFFVFILLGIIEYLKSMGLFLCLQMFGSPHDL